MKKIVRTCTALGAFFVVALVVAGCGSSSVPSSDVAVVAGNPISKQAFNHWMYVAEKGNASEAAEEGGQASPVIVPTDPPNFNNCILQVRDQLPAYASEPTASLRSDCKQLFTSLKTQVLGFLIEAYWYQGSAHKAGVRLSQAQFDKTLKAEVKAQFGGSQSTETAELAASGETPADYSWHLRVSTVYQKLLDKQVPTITTALERQYYAAHPADFGTPASRNIEIIQTNSSSQIDKAQAALKSGTSFASVAKQYSVSSDTKDSGGVMTDVTRGELETAVSNAIFSAPLDKLEGPIKGSFGYYLVEVTKITPAVTDPFSKEEPEIKQLLQNQYETKAETKVDNLAKKQWGSSTKCGALYSMSDCAGYVAPKTTTSTTPTSAAGSSVTSTSGAGSSAGSTVTSGAGSSAGSTATTGAGSSAGSTAATGTSTTK